MDAFSVRRLTRVSAVAIAAAFCSSAFAQTYNLPLAATFSQEIRIFAPGDSPLQGFLPDQESTSSSAGALLDGAAAVTGYYAGGIGVLSLAISNAPTPESAATQVNYWFEVIGQPSVAQVLLTGNGSVNAANVGNTNAVAQMDTPWFDTYAIAGNVSGSYVPTNQFNVNAPETVLTNTPYKISLIVNGSIDSAAGIDGSIDPSVTLTGNTTGLSLAFSPDAFPLSPVPEPGTVWLSIMGLGFLYMVRRGVFTSASDA